MLETFKLNCGSCGRVSAALSPSAGVIGKLFKGIFYSFPSLFLNVTHKFPQVSCWWNLICMLRSRGIVADTVGRRGNVRSPGPNATLIVWSHVEPFTGSARKGEEGPSAALHGLEPNTNYRDFFYCPQVLNNCSSLQSNGPLAFTKHFHILSSILPQNQPWK